MSLSAIRPVIGWRSKTLVAAGIADWCRAAGVARLRSNVNWNFDFDRLLNRSADWNLNVFFNRHRNADDFFDGLFSRNTFPAGNCFFDGLRFGDADIEIDRSCFFRSNHLADLANAGLLFVLHAANNVLVLFFSLHPVADFDLAGLSRWLADSHFVLVVFFD